VLLGCSGRAAAPKENARADDNTVELVFTYGSEKQGWINDVTKSFNDSENKTGGGKRIKVTAIPMGSGECIDELLAGKRKAHLTSPASGAYIEIGNGRSQTKDKTDLVGPVQNLVLSPVVIAMWKSMADRLRKDGKEVGWADVQNLARDPKGWDAVGAPQWGEFRFAHTHPLYSNSGLIAVLAEVYAATGKTRGLTLDDLKEAKVGKYLQELEHSVVHYGSSTGFFGKKMVENGRQYLHAAVLYENMVIESYDKKLRDPLVAVYPKEGTFWSDHPVGVVQRDWVSDEHKEAAKVYVDYLRAKPQQVKAMKYGFRPADEKIPLDAPLDPAHGVNPDEPKKLMRVPPADVLEGVLGLWRKHKKPSRVVLVMDTSGSMQAMRKMESAQDAARELVESLSDRDQLSLLAFSDRLAWVHKEGVRMDAAGKKKATESINDLVARGETALYDATASAYRYLLDNPSPGTISAVVVLTDGEDNKSKATLDELIEQIKTDYEKKTIRVFTIAYGQDANEAILKRIADATQAKEYKGDPKTILEVLKDIATFF
jgi:Ca-activated chloride channel family protein